MKRSLFIEGYAQLMIYFCDHIDADISDEYVTDDGFELGKWLSKVRQLWEQGELNSKQVLMLHKVGLSSKQEKQAWETLYFYAKDYYIEHGNTDISRTYRTVDGLMLGAWIERQKINYAHLSVDQRQKLSDIGVYGNA